MSKTRRLWINNKGIKVLTDQGYKDFQGVLLVGKASTRTVTFDDETSITASKHHKFFTDLLEPISCESLKIGDVLFGRDTDRTITNIEIGSVDDVYDLVEVVGDDRTYNRYFTNGVLSHNCQFISSDALLVDSMVIQQIEQMLPQESEEVNDFVFWDNIRPGDQYLIAIDPSTGSGSDFSVITVVQFPSMKQVAEFRSNTMSSPEIYRKFKWVVHMIEQVGATCYFTVENNGVGEGVISLFMNDENPPMFAEFVSDNSSSRLGMNMNGRTKITACINFKEMVQSGKLTINSKNAVTELKSYIRRKGSYEAQEGSTDDCISSWLLITRILEEIASYEQDAFDKLYMYTDYDYNENTDQLYNEDDPDSAPLGILF